ncbi:hypothetical protein BSKO_06790 [Bryopsis sp. KO-2023]|nr:hypothetical protein BSKO_06790 [Bryopsis sp. KO-2023]
MVQEALQSFDSTHAKTLRQTHTTQNGANNPQSINVVDLSVQSLVGATLVGSPTPSILILQAESTCIPAEVMNNIISSASCNTTPSNMELLSATTAAAPEESEDCCSPRCTYSISS